MTMTADLSAARPATTRAVRVWEEEGVLAGQCPACDVYLERVAPADGLTAADAFLALHPDQPHLPTRLAPAGWLRPLCAPGALSQ